ncbi:hypothetical protein BU24DRAFT_423832 [Aaosphaeria arxii CBS 175.79]|uniref:Uncharacterized protein n=1 Tax=Aaosphaeria arxii CBS 175.79 TaxID=1450172 RepID=A0A6A5XP50_9PLEO|nr:uncharacterized protein BU24DRAFT_423832 [Aaosphaeria arxii CBS 175.79]KAF2014922.1 hypothetical protein BU24DRAFT_423832 [Aaosphaeria arxii CBS 175.79]
MTTPAMPEGPKQENDRRSSDASASSGHTSTYDRRRSSASGTRYAALEALKRPADPQSTERRSSLQDSYTKPGFLGSLWNNYTRGPANPPAAQKPHEQRDTTTLRQ